MSSSESSDEEDEQELEAGLYMQLQQAEFYEANDRQSIAAYLSKNKMTITNNDLKVKTVCIQVLEKQANVGGENAGNALSTQNKKVEKNTMGEFQELSSVTIQLNKHVDKPLQDAIGKAAENAVAGCKKKFNTIIKQNVYVNKKKKTSMAPSTTEKRSVLKTNGVRAAYKCFTRNLKRKLNDSGNEVAKEVNVKQQKLHDNNASSTAKRGNIRTHKYKTIETIDLDSSSNSENDDVIYIKSPPLEVITLLDSGDEQVNEQLQKESSPLKTLIQKKTGTFAKPLAAPVEKENRTLDNSSRCVSPSSSIMSTDEFIAQADRHRLIQRTQINFDEISVESDTLLEAPIVNNSLSNDQRSTVIDVYDSESNDTVYSKGVNENPTIIRSINSSSDERNNEAPSQPKVKRLKKRLHKVAKNRGVHPTIMPYISKGQAIENCGVDDDPVSLTSRRQSVRSTSVGEMSDSQFVATLNSLAQGEQTEACEDNYDNDTKLLADEDKSDDPNKLPSARDLVEKVLNVQNELTQEVDAVSNLNGTEEEVTEITKEQPVLHVQENTQLSKDNEISDGPTDSTVKAERDANCNNDTTNSWDKAVPDEIMETCDSDQPDDQPEDVQMPSTDQVNEVIDVDVDVEDVESYNDIKMYAVACRLKGAESNDGVGWYEEMSNFYNKSWNDENFDMEKVLKQMNPDKRNWRIKQADLRLSGRVTKKIKCFNCFEIGHVRSKCTKPRRPLICFICGGSGHRDVRCPNTICLRCGSQTLSYTKSCNVCSFHNKLTCAICNLKGHVPDNCPDRWRRYHSTIPDNSEDALPDAKYNRRRFCSNCGKAGHWSDVCSQMYLMEYPPIASKIQSYLKTYQNSLVPFRQDQLVVNLLCKPESDRTMSFLNLRPDGYYMRFLKAVNTNKSLLRCRRICYKQEKKKAKRERSANLAADSDDNDDVAVVPTRTTQTTHHLDSDSNYSFSEHFGQTPAVKQHEEQRPMLEPQLNSEQQQLHYKFTDKGPTPNFLSLETVYDNAYENSNDDTHQMNVNNPNGTLGISQRIIGNDSKTETAYVAALEEDIGFEYEEADQDSDNESESDAEPQDSLNNAFSTAQIHINKANRNYLCTPSGVSFLESSSIQHNVKIDIIEGLHSGYFLSIQGTRQEQDAFYQELLRKLRSVPKQTTLQKVPKRARMLIRTLEENMALLLTNLGNPHKLYRRMLHFEKTHTKLNVKLADKCRRQLNMILLGKAGLLNGEMHVDSLLANLRHINKNYNSNDILPKQLRDEIDEHYKLIFTSFRHENYDQMLLQYTEMSNKHQMPPLNFDEHLPSLGKQTKSTNSSVVEGAAPDSHVKAIKNITKIIRPPTATPLTTVKTDDRIICKTMSPAMSKLELQSSEGLTKNKSKLMGPPPFVNPENRSTVDIFGANILQSWIKACETAMQTILLSTPMSKSGHCHASLYWSRECGTIITKCLELTQSYDALKRKLSTLLSFAENSMMTSQNCTQLRNLLKLLRNPPNMVGK